MHSKMSTHIEHIVISVHAIHVQAYEDYDMHFTFCLCPVNRLVKLKG